MKTPLKILILEDSPFDADLLQRDLRKAGFEFEAKVVDAREEYCDALENFSPGLILSDHSLPQFNSFEALRILKETGLRVPFILVTGSVSEEFAVECIHEGAHDYILKDRMARLPGAIQNALERCRLEKEHQKFLDELISNEKLFQEAEQIAHFGIWESDVTRGTTKWSAETFRIFGYEPGEILPSQKNFLKNIHPDDRPHVQHLLEYATMNTGSLRMNFRVRNKDGSIRYIRSDLLVERNGTTKPIRMTGFNQDITETKLAEESLRKSEANLRTIFNGTDVSYVLLDFNLYIISFNRTAFHVFKKLTGRSLTEGQGFDHYLPDDSEGTLKTRYAKALEGEHIHYEVSYPLSDGTLSWYHVRLLSVSDWENKVLGIIVAMTDITEQKNSDLQRDQITSDIIQRNRDLEQFAYIVSHNLRSPVAKIMGLSETLKSGNLSNEDIEHIIHGLSDSADKLDSVITDLNHILQVKREMSEKKELTRFSNLVSDIKFSISDLIEKEQVEIHEDFSEVDTMMCLKSYLYSIFYNLISNSIKYRQPNINPVIEIKSYRYKDKIEIVFKDKGMGIDLEKKGDQVFGLYKRFHKQVEGKGMGLFMVKTQVETLGGKISVQSRINTGTEFRIEFKE